MLTYTNAFLNKIKILIPFYSTFYSVISHVLAFIEVLMAFSNHFISKLYNIL